MRQEGTTLGAGMDPSQQLKSRQVGRKQSRPHEDQSLRWPQLEIAPAEAPGTSHSEPPSAAPHF